MRIGSLFSGIGGLELGLEWAGVGHTVWQVEQDPYCLAVLAKHWPDARRFTDVREVGAHNLPAVDVLCGGFPCQDISVAGKRAGIRGERSGLWSEYLRIVRELRPDYVVVENVAALLNGGLDVVLGALAEGGYDAEWDCIPASSVGAHHRRDRLFVLAYANGGPAHPEQEPRAGRSTPYPGGYGSQESMADANGQRELQPEGCQPEIRRRAGDGGGALPDPYGTRLEGQRPVAGRTGEELRDARVAGWWATEPDVGRVANGVPQRVDRLRALGNAVVPQVAEVVGRRLMQLDAELADAA